MGYGWDDLGRLVLTDRPAGAAADTSYAYDLAGRLTRAVQGAEVVERSYDALGRLVAETGDS